MAVAVHWFRLGLRVHDNPALLDAAAAAGSSRLYTLYVFDPDEVAGPPPPGLPLDPNHARGGDDDKGTATADAVPGGGLSCMGAGRLAFLLASLADLDAQLQRRGSRLHVAHGDARTLVPALVAHWGARVVTWETATEPRHRRRDAVVAAALSQAGVQWREYPTHTLFPLEQYTDAGKGAPAPGTYQAFCRLMTSLGMPRAPVPAPARLPASGTGAEAGMRASSHAHMHVAPFALPTTAAALEHVGVPRATVAAAIATATADRATEPASEPSTGGGGTLFPTGALLFPGGETEALRRLAATVLARPAWVVGFAKPDTAPATLLPSTTGLSPYLAMGCLSVARVWHALAAITEAHPHTHTLPPVSLTGQLLWREFFYVSAATTAHFDRVVGNAACRPIPWHRDPARLAAWTRARTGYPWIDACLTQLHTQVRDSSEHPHTIHTCR
jgi:cryptochrome